eukprot:6190067-Pleurochrysis_carterae.AAC.2
MDVLQTTAHDVPITLSNIGKDNLEMLCCFLPVLAIGAFAQVSKEAREAAESESVWRAHLYSLAEEHPELSEQFQTLFAGIEAERSSSRASFFTARNSLRSWQCTQAAASWKAKDLSSLKELGAVVNAGAVDAAFIPFDTIQTPVKMKAALELLHFVSSTPPDLSGGARAKTDFYRQTGELLGRESLRTALQRAEKHVHKIRRKSDAELGEFLLAPWPQQQQSRASSSASSYPGPPHKTLLLQPVAATRSERALERRLAYEIRMHARTRIQLETAAAAAATFSARNETIQVKEMRINELERLVIKLESKLAKAPSMEAHETLKADLGRAHRNGRAVQRQHEDADARGARVLARLRKERDAAVVQVEEKQKLCNSMQKKLELSAENTAACVRRVGAIRSGAATLVAEKRAAAAEAREAELLKAADLHDAEKKSVECRAAAGQAALDAANADVKEARGLVSELRLRLSSKSAEINALKCDLAKSFQDMGNMKQALEVEKEEAVLTAQAAGAAATKQAVLEVKDNMVINAVSDPHNLCRHSKDIFNAGLKPFAAGSMLRYEPIGIKDGKIHRRGRYKHFLGITKAGKAEVGRKHWKNRSKELSSHMGVIAGGAENVSKLITVHQKSNRQLYQQIGVSMEKKLSVEQTAALCNETSGTLGAAMRRHLSSCGINVATKLDVQEYFRSSWHECETGRVTIPHPKRRGHVLTGAWLRVSDLRGVIQCAMQQFAAKGELAWPSNISGQECWFQLIIDKGSSATKIVLKYNCIAFPESVRNVSLVGMLDRVKDTYEMMSIFRPLFDQFNQINQRGLCVWLPWQQLLPADFKASALDARPMHAFVDEATPAAAPTPAVPLSAPLPSLSSAPTYPDCRSCAKWGARCPSKLRRSHASNGEGNIKMNLCFGDGPGLVANTWNLDCVECTADEGGQLRALRRQWEEVQERGQGWRRLRGMLGGDWLSISVPLGLGGPKNKQFCMVCLASLHDTNAAGVPHVPDVSVCGLCMDPRPSHVARPQLRAGTASIAAQAAAYATAVDQHAAGKLNRKPEPANFDSCVEQPLVWAGGHMLDLISCTPLHFMLGITVDLVNCLEWELKTFDATLRREILDGQLAEELNSLAAEASRLTGEVLRWEGHLAHHSGSIDVIEATEGAADAIERGKKPPKRGRSYVPLPLESEYRSHLREVRDAQSKLEQLAPAIDALQRKVVKVSSEDPGPFAQAFIDTMNLWNFQRQAYHSGMLSLCPSAIL